MQQLPHSELHERALISCILWEPLTCGRDALDAFGDEQPFFCPECALIWSAIQRIDLEKIDVVTVGDYLGARMDYTAILDISREVQHTAQFDQHLRFVRKHHAQRKIIAELTHALGCLYDPKAPVDDVVSAIRNGVSMAITEGHQMPHISDAAKELLDMCSQGKMGSPTGFHQLDRVLAPMPPGSMSVIAARPKMGKTALAMGMAINLAALGYPVGVISMEMPKSQLFARMLASAACISSRPQDIKHQIGTEQCTKAIDALNRLPIYIEDTLHDWSKIKRVIRSLNTQHGIKHWFIDHIGLVRVNGNGMSREREVATISNDCKQMALQMRGWVFPLSQLNRSAEGVMPQLHHLRESGSIEQDADAVIFLHYQRTDTREEFNHIQSGGKIDVTAKIAANRHGPTGPVSIPFYPKYSLFSNEIATTEEMQQYE